MSDVSIEPRLTVICQKMTTSSDQCNDSIWTLAWKMVSFCFPILFVLVSFCFPKNVFCALWLELVEIHLKTFSVKRPFRQVC